MHIMANEAIAPNPKRRFYSPELKVQVVAQCRADGASIAAVALAHGINANIVHRWLREHPAAAPKPINPFIPLNLPSPEVADAAPVCVAGSPSADIRVEIRRGTGVITVTRFVDDGQLPLDNNWIENQIRPIAIGRNNWLFAGSLRPGQRAAAVMSLIQSARMNGHDPYAYLKDVLTRLPTHKASQIEELLPHRWQAHAT
ncbi:MAG: transposase domain-containing protein [Comamonadaceae bacterium]|nr:transposase domain-containing protein [Comamonadaceae bacterium]